MSPRLVLITLICINFATHVPTNDTYRCPSEARMAIGFKRGSECVTWMLLEPTNADISAVSFLNNFCRSTFLNGSRYGFTDQDGIDRSKWWFDSKVISKTWKYGNMIWPYGHYFFRITSGEDCTWASWRYSCYIAVDAQWDDDVYPLGYWYWTFTSKKLAKIYDHWLFRDIDPNDYLKWFVSQRRQWLCPLYTLNQNGDFRVGKVHRCKEIMTWKEYHVACVHSPYRNCNYKKAEHCHFDEPDQKWYKYSPLILSKAESPYGIPCPTSIPKEWKRQCDKTCRGNWGEWSAEPSEEHLRCDTITVEKYAPAESGAAPCNKSGPACCMAKRVIKYNDSCTDFAFNTTINLKKQGCKNNGASARDFHGHLKCVCPDRYIGVQCEEDVCEGACQNGGTCIPARGKPHCFCRRGFTGSNCSEALKSCGKSAACQNGGTCETLIIGVEVAKFCKCKDGYGGITCEHKVQKCENDSCSYNGACREDAEYGTIVCTCYESYHGKHCEMRKGKSIERFINRPTSNIFNVVIGFVLGFLVLTLCFGGAAVHRRRRRRRGGRSYESSYASTFSTAISSAFGRQRTVKTKKEDTRSLAKSSSKAVGVSRVG